MSIIRKLEAALDRQDKEAIYWRPTMVGQRLVGQLIKRYQLQGRYGVREAFLVEKQDGTRVSVVLTKVLVENFANVEPGTWIAMEYLGKTGRFIRWNTAVYEEE